MNSFVKYILSFFLFVNLSSILYSQNITDELRKVRDAYIVNQNLSFDVSAYSFRTNTDKNPKLISKGFVKKTKSNYYSNFLSYELIVKGEKTLIVDHEARTLDYFENKLSPKNISKDFQPNIDSLSSSSDSIVLIKLKDDIRQFVIYSKNEEIIRTEVFVDKTNFINRILFYYAPSNEDYEAFYDRVDVYYKNIKTSLTPDAFFSLDKYFTKVKNKYYPTAQYQKYKISYNNSK